MTQEQVAHIHSDAHALSQRIWSEIKNYAEKHEYGAVFYVPYALGEALLQFLNTITAHADEKTTIAIVDKAKDLMQIALNTAEKAIANKSAGRQ